MFVANKSIGQSTGQPNPTFRRSSDATSFIALRLAAHIPVVQFIYGCHLGSIVVVQRCTALYTRSASHRIAAMQVVVLGYSF